MHPTQLFRALSDLTRLRTLSLLVSQGELCVCELTQALGLPQPKVSHHLAALRRAGLVSDRKEGLWIYYRIASDLPEWVLQVILTAAQGTRSELPFSDDTAALAEISSRSGAICGAQDDGSPEAVPVISSS